MSSCEVDVVMRYKKAFEFWILAEKSVSISVKTFFFRRSPVFGRKKRLNFRAFREIPSQFLDKPCDTDSRPMKIRVKVVCTFLTLSKKPPPFPNPGYAWVHDFHLESIAHFLCIFLSMSIIMTSVLR